MIGSQPIQLNFDSSLEDKIETPGETPDPDKGGLGGARPLGMSSSSSSLSIQNHPPPPPSAPPPPPPIDTMSKKRLLPAPPPPPKLDQDVSKFIFILFPSFHALFLLPYRYLENFLNLLNFNCTAKTYFYLLPQCFFYLFIFIFFFSFYYDKLFIFYK